MTCVFSQIVIRFEHVQALALTCDQLLLASLSCINYTVQTCHTHAGFGPTTSTVCEQQPAMSDVFVAFVSLRLACHISAIASTKCNVDTCKTPCTFRLADKLSCLVIFHFFFFKALTQHSCTCCTTVVKRRLETYLDAELYPKHSL